jgi:hypothetical protein
MDEHQRHALKSARARLVLKRNEVLNGLRSRTENWGALHEVCREIAAVDEALGSSRNGKVGHRRNASRAHLSE